MASLGDLNFDPSQDYLSAARNDLNSQGLNFDPAKDYLGTGGQRPQYANGRPGMSATPSASPAAADTSSLAGDSVEAMKARAAANRARTSWSPSAPEGAPVGGTTAGAADAAAGAAGDAAGAAGDTAGIGARTWSALTQPRSMGALARGAYDTSKTVMGKVGPWAALAGEGAGLAQNITNPQRIARASDNLYGTYGDSLPGAKMMDVAQATGNTLLSGMTLGFVSPETMNHITGAGRKLIGPDLRPIQPSSSVQSDADILNQYGIRPESLHTDADFEKARAVLDAHRKPAAPGTAQPQDQELQPVQVQAQRMGSPQPAGAGSALNSGTIYRNPDGSYTNMPGKDSVPYQFGDARKAAQAQQATNVPQGGDHQNQILVRGAWVPAPGTESASAGGGLGGGYAMPSGSGGGSGYAMSSGGSSSSGGGLGGGLGDGMTAADHYERATRIREESLNEQRARQQASLAEGVNVADEYRRRQDMENLATRAETQLERDKLKGLAWPSQLAAREAGIQQLRVGSVTPRDSTPTGPTPEQEANIGAIHQRNAIQQAESDRQDQLAQQQGQLARQQGLAQGMDLNQRRRLDAIYQQLSDINTKPEDRRALQEQALVMQGKDPRADQYVKVSASTGETDQMGQPVKSDYVLNTGTGQWMAPPAPPRAQQAAPEEGSIQYKDGKPYKVVNGKPVPMNQTDGR